MSLDPDKTKTSRAKRWAFWGLVLITVVANLTVGSIALWSQSLASHFSERLASGQIAVNGATLEMVNAFISPMLDLLISIPLLNLVVIVGFYIKQRKANVSSSSVRT